MMRGGVIIALLLVAAPAAAEQYGALAYSLSADRFGRSWTYSDADAARSRAIEGCEAAGGTGCQIVATTTDGCGAMARTPGTETIALMGASWDYGSHDAARDRAMAECRKRNDDGDCRVIASVCSSGE